MLGAYQFTVCRESASENLMTSRAALPPSQLEREAAIGSRALLPSTGDGACDDRPYRSPRRETPRTKRASRESKAIGAGAPLCFGCVVSSALPVDCD